MRDVKSLREGLERAREDALRVDEERRASTRDIHAAVEALADRARAYDRAFDENKRLHNEIQDLKGSIRVFCRVRPGVASVDERRGLAGSEASLEASALEASALSSSRPAARARLNEDGDPVRVELDVERRPTFRGPPDVVPGSSSSSEKGVKDAARGVFDTRSFTFDRAFGPEATQRDVYAECSALVRCACDGYNATRFSRTGRRAAGRRTRCPARTADPPAFEPPRERVPRTRRPHRRRELPRVGRSVFVRRGAFEGWYGVLVFRRRARDLQRAVPRLTSPSADATVEVKDHGASSGSNAPDATYRPVRTAEDVAAVMAEGEAMRATGATAMNRRSSRSHSVVCVRVDGRSVETGAATRGVLYLVDLAGSERVAKSEATGERLKEAQHINKSLSALGGRRAGAEGRRRPCAVQKLQAHDAPERRAVAEVRQGARARAREPRAGERGRNPEHARVREARERGRAREGEPKRRVPGGREGEEEARGERGGRGVTRAKRGGRAEARTRRANPGRAPTRRRRGEVRGTRAKRSGARAEGFPGTHADEDDGGRRRTTCPGSEREPEPELARRRDRRPTSDAVVELGGRKGVRERAERRHSSGARVRIRRIDEHVSPETRLRRRRGSVFSSTLLDHRVRRAPRRRRGRAPKPRSRRRVFGDREGKERRGAEGAHTREVRGAGTRAGRRRAGRGETSRRKRTKTRASSFGDARLGSKMGLLFDADHEDSVFLDEDIAPDVFSSDGVPSPGDASLGEPRRDVSSSAGSATRRRSLSSGASSETRRDRAAASPSGSVTSSLRGDARASSRASDARLAALQRLEAAKAAREEAAARARAEMRRQAARSPFEVRPKSAAAAPKSPAPWPSPPAKAALRPINNRATDGPSSSPRRPSGSPPVADEAPRPRDVPEKSASDYKDDEGAPPAPPVCFASPVAAIGPVVEEVVVKKKKSMYSRAKAAFGFGKKKKAAQERWQ